MRPQYEFKKFPILATVLCAVCLILAVCGSTCSLMDYYYFYAGPLFAGLVLIVAAVLIIAGLTTVKPLLLKVISIIVSVTVVIVNFSITIAEYSDRRVVFFGIALLMLVASVLAFVYFVTAKNERIRKMYLVTGSILSALILIYAITYTIQDIVKSVTDSVQSQYPYYFILVGYAIISSLPMVIYFSLSKKEEEPKEEEKVEEQSEAQPEEKAE